MILKNGKRIDGSSLTSIAVVDDLLGGVGTTEALSANQGRILNEKIEAINSFDVIRLDESSPAYVENAPNGALGINLWQLETGIYTFPDNTDFYYGTTDQITLEPTEGGLYYNAEPPLIGELRIYKEDSFVWAICECGSVKYTTISIVLDEAIIGTLYEDNINSYQEKLVSGTNIKTIDGESILGSGDIALAEVAKTGSYNDLSNKPTIPTVPTNISAFTNDRGYITGYTETDPTVPSHVKAITTANIEDWNNKSEFSGSYNDLTDKPTIPTTTSELTNNSGFLTSIPDNYVVETDLATVAVTGEYDDLANRPTIPTKVSELENDNGYITTTAIPNQTSELINDSGFITVQELATVASTGSYNDLSDKPTVPTKMSELTNDNDYVTEYALKYYHGDGTNMFGWGSTASSGEDMTANYGMSAAEVAGVYIGATYEWNSRLSYSANNYGQITYMVTDWGYADDGTEYNEVYMIMNGVGYTYVYNADYSSTGVSQVYKDYWGGEYSGGVACFTGDTLVLTPDGQKKIVDIQVGDKVLSVNKAKTNIVTSEVTKLVNHPETEVYYIKLENGETIKATGSHPFLTKEKGKCNVRSLSKGNTLRDYKGNEHIIKSITKKTVDTTVYEIVVGDTYNYFVGTDGIQVFNEPSVIYGKEA